MTGDQKTVSITYRNVYGNDLAYPAPGCEAGNLFLRLTGKSTLRPCDLVTIRSLGYEVVITAHVPEGVTA